jgi:type II secretory pathway component PulF
VPAFQYQAAMRNREDHIETGTIVAANESDARSKLKEMKFVGIRLKRLTGFKALIANLTPDIK